MQLGDPQTTVPALLDPADRGLRNTSQLGKLALVEANPLAGRSESPADTSHQASPSLLNQ